MYQLDHLDTDRHIYECNGKKTFCNIQLLTLNPKNAIR